MSEYFVSIVNIYKLHFLLKIKFLIELHYLMKYRVPDMISQTNIRQNLGPIKVVLA